MQSRFRYTILGTITLTVTAALFALALKPAWSVILGTHVDPFDQVQLVTHRLPVEKMATPSIELRARLLEVSHVPTQEQRRPYREVLVVHAYEVLDVQTGNVRADRIRVTHWSVYDDIEQNTLPQHIGQTITLRLRPFDDLPELASVTLSDTLDICATTPLYHDLGQTLSFAAPVAPEQDYDSELTLRMPAFLALRHQLRLVALGDSRSYDGLRTQLFLGESNLHTPMAYNLAVPSTGIETIWLMHESYLRHLPQLEWVVVGVSPRMFNRHWSEQYKLTRIRQSPGLASDRARADALWGRLPAGVLTADQLKQSEHLASHWHTAPWGWRGAGDAQTNVQRSTQFPAGQKFEHDEARWRLLERFVEAAGERGVRVLMFTPPIHPHTAGAPVVDTDGTPRKAYGDVVARLDALAQRHGNLTFTDIHQGGYHDFNDAHFRNYDHLNNWGAARLTRQLELLRRDLVQQPRHRSAYRDVR